MNVSPIVKTSCVLGSVFTNVARIHDSRMPMTGVSARITTLDRSDETLIHSLRRAVGRAATSSRRVRGSTRWMGEGRRVELRRAEAGSTVAVVMVMVVGSFVRLGE